MTLFSLIQEYRGIQNESQFTLPWLIKSDTGFQIAIVPTNFTHRVYVATDTNPTSNYCLWQNATLYTTQENLFIHIWLVKMHAIIRYQSGKMIIDRSVIAQVDKECTKSVHSIPLPWWAFYHCSVHSFCRCCQRLLISLCSHLWFSRSFSDREIILIHSWL